MARYVVKDDLVFRLNQWRIALPRLQPSEVSHLVEIEKRAKEFGAVLWKPDAIKQLEEMVSGDAITGNRRQVRQIIRRKFGDVWRLQTNFLVLAGLRRKPG